MKKIMKLIQNKKVILTTTISLLVILILIVGVSFVMTKKNYLKSVETNDYELVYDNTWKIKEKSNNKIIFKHKSKSEVKIEIMTLNDENKYQSISELIDEIIYNIKENNSNYNLLQKEDTFLTKNNYQGYKLLYESGDNEVLVSVFKKEDKLVFISYLANNTYFDILLDSVNNIIYNFDIKEEVYALVSRVNVPEKEFEYTNSKQVISLLNTSQDVEIASNNYYVSYSIPSNFLSRDFSSNLGSFTFQGLENSNITLTSNILNRNIYEYLNRDSSLSFYTKFDNYRKYSDYIEGLVKLKDNANSYIYKNSYHDDKNTLEENVIMVYNLDKNHILIIEIKATGVNIPEKLIKMIKINSTSNYANYLKSEVQDEEIISELKRITSLTNGTYDDIRIKLPVKYIELDDNSNIYATRHFGLNYNKDKKMYDYEVKYQLTSTLIKNNKSEIDRINSLFKKAYGSYKYLTSRGNVKLNNKTFARYTGGYTDLGGIMFTSLNRYNYYINKEVLFFELPKGGYLEVEVSGNGKEITNSILEEVTNFQVLDQKLK